MRNAEALLARTREVAAGLAKERSSRQLRRRLEPSDFQRLHDIGLHLVSVPVAYGGMWEDLSRSVRPLCELLRILATEIPHWLSFSLCILGCFLFGYRLYYLYR